MDPEATLVAILRIVLWLEHAAAPVRFAPSHVKILSKQPVMSNQCDRGLRQCEQAFLYGRYLALAHSGTHVTISYWLRIASLVDPSTCAESQLPELMGH